MQTRIMNGVAALFAVAIFVAIVASAAGAFSRSASVTGGGPAESGAVSIAIKDLAFVQGVRTVTSGTTVTWHNRDGTTHTVTANDRTFNSGPTDGGHTFAHRFTTTGRFRYFCSIHPFMKGVITVVTPYGKG
jgi:plastocyanin